MSSPEAPAQHPICELGNPNGFLAQRARAEDAHIKMLQLAKSLIGKTGKECREAGLTLVPEDWDTAVLEQVTWDSMLWACPQPLQRIEINVEAKLP